MSAYSRALGVPEGFAHGHPVGSDDDRDAAGAVVQDSAGVWVPLGEQVASMPVQEAGHNDVEDLTLERVSAGPESDGMLKVVIGARFGVVSRPCWRVRGHVHLLALGHQGVAGQRVGILAAYQHSDTAYTGIADPQSSSIARSPDELFVEGRDDLAVVAQDAPVVPYQRVGVPDAADARVGAFVESQGYEHSGFPRGVSNRAQLRT